MRTFVLRETPVKNTWEILHNGKKVTEFFSEDSENLERLSRLLQRVYTADGVASLIVDLPEVEVEVPSKHNRSDNPMDPSNSWGYAIVDEEDMESALTSLIELHKEEFESFCQDSYLARREDV